VLCKKLADMTCVTVDCGGLDEDAVDGVPKGKVLGIKRHLDVTLTLVIRSQVRVNVMVGTVLEPVTHVSMSCPSGTFVVGMRTDPEQRAQSSRLSSSGLGWKHRQPWICGICWEKGGVAKGIGELNSVCG
jgi:hypothetical protein